MPTAALSGYSFSNIGPLTTTFTPPASCISSFGDVLLADASRTTSYYRKVDCEWAQAYECFPSGSSMASEHSNAITQTSATATMSMMGYYSPGLVCPSGWATMGIAARSGSESPSLSGAFNFASATGVQGEGVHPRNIISALAPSETAAWCCPSSMTPVARGGCTSRLSSYEIKSFCVHPYYTSSSITTMDPSRTSDYIAVTQVPGLIMMHQPSDKSESHVNAAAQAESIRWGQSVPFVGFISMVLALGTAMVLL